MPRRIQAIRARQEELKDDSERFAIAVRATIAGFSERGTTMNRWSEPTATWELMIKGSPLRSGYFWMVALFSGLAVLGTYQATALMRGFTEVMVLAPMLAALMLLMLVAALGAIRAIYRARREGGQELSLRAFEKMRIYFYCAGLVALGTTLLVAFNR